MYMPILPMNIIHIKSANPYIKQRQSTSCLSALTLQHTLCILSGRQCHALSTLSPAVWSTVPMVSVDLQRNPIYRSVSIEVASLFPCMTTFRSRFWYVSLEPFTFSPRRKKTRIEVEHRLHNIYIYISIEYERWTYILAWWNSYSEYNSICTNIF